MAKKRIKGLDRSVYCTRLVDTCVETVDGLERAHINMATGEITYGPDVCINEDALHGAFKRQGLELEDVNESCPNK